MEVRHRLISVIKSRRRRHRGPPLSLGISFFHQICSCVFSDRPTAMAAPSSAQLAFTAKKLQNSESTLVNNSRKRERKYDTLFSKISLTTKEQKPNQIK
jgi:hypothetical protein